MVDFIIFCIFCFAAWGIYQKITKPKQHGSRSPSQHAEPIYPAQNTPLNYIFSPTADTLAFLEALVFMAKSDGQLREPERLEIITYLRDIQPEHKNSPDDFLEDRIREIAFIPSKEYKQYINSLGSKSLQQLLIWSKRVAATQNNLHPFTEYLLEEIENKCNTTDDNQYEIVDGVRQYVIS